ncbi:hypothetical protein GBAR_LOCUS13696 [Geodia barretti]|uniref:Uncharacterized protein n=1 Tax=Geodia barretti TaxID=519541 RepID=A0AA35WQZ4_GEOBA|nr:hypothetical protein GBAR_LOCUS13696 [Geodia barretti]
MILFIVYGVGAQLTLVFSCAIQRKMLVYSARSFCWLRP